MSIRDLLKKSYHGKGPGSRGGHGHYDKRGKFEYDHKDGGGSTPMKPVPASGRVCVDCGRKPSAGRDGRCPDCHYMATGDTSTKDTTYRVEPKPKLGSGSDNTPFGKMYDHVHVSHCNRCDKETELDPKTHLCKDCQKVADKQHKDFSMSPRMCEKCGKNPAFRNSRVCSACYDAEPKSAKKKTTKSVGIRAARERLDKSRS